MTEADLIVRDAKPPDGWWVAKCKHCGQVITKHDFTREDCVKTALASKHSCEASGQLGLL